MFPFWHHRLQCCRGRQHVRLRPQQCQPITKQPNLIFDLHSQSAVSMTELFSSHIEQWFSTRGTWAPSGLWCNCKGSMKFSDTYIFLKIVWALQTDIISQIVHFFWLRALSVDGQHYFFIRLLLFKVCRNLLLKTHWLAKFSIEHLKLNYTKALWRWRLPFSKKRKDGEEELLCNGWEPLMKMHEWTVIKPVVKNRNKDKN